MKKRMLAAPWQQLWLYLWPDALAGIRPQKRLRETQEQKRERKQRVRDREKGVHPGLCG